MGRARKRKFERSAVASEAPLPELSDTEVSPLVVFLATFAVALAGFATTFARFITLVDSGELTLACAEFGVAHPPGFPTYVVLGHLASLIPAGSPAARLAGFSAFCAALSAGFVALLAAEAQLLTRTTRRPATALPASTLMAVSVAVGLTWAFGTTLWFYASVVEVYTLNIALAAAVLWLLIRWARLRAHKGSEADRTLVAASLLYGLALGDHHVTVLLMFPALALFAGLMAGKKLFRSPVFAKSLAAAAGAGIAVYALLPIRASAHPVLNWGDPSNLQRFFWHVSAKQYQVNVFSSGAGVALDHLGTFFAWAADQWTLAGIAAAAVGAVLLFRRNKPVFWLVAGIVALNVLYTINYDIAEDTDAYYLPSYLALSIGIAVGIGALADIRTRLRRASLLVPIAALILPAFVFVSHRGRSDRRHDRIAPDYVADTLASIPPGGVLVTSDWQLYSPFLYMHHLERFRPDVTVVDANLTRYSWYVQTYLERQYPDAIAAARNEERAYLDLQARWEQGLKFDPDELTRRYHAFLNALLGFGSRRGGAAITLPMEAGIGEGFSWTPHGLTLRLSPPGGTISDAAPPLHLEPFLDGRRLDPVAGGKVRANYALMTANRARFLMISKQNAEARRMLELARQIDDSRDAPYQFAGELDLSEGKLDDAVSNFAAALNRNPGNTAARAKLESIERTRGTGR